MKPYIIFIAWLAVAKGKIKSLKIIIYPRPGKLKTKHINKQKKHSKEVAAYHAK